jgi:signal transduction histidine kinase/CheY-like chemotaxis protein
VHAADRPLVLDAWRGLLDGRRQEFNEEYRYVPPGRPACVVRTHAVPIVSDGRTIGLMGIMLDITAQRQAEEQGRQLQLRLQHTQKLEALGQLTGGIAHEFNNILATTLGYAALAQRKPEGDGKLVHYMQQIVAAGERGRDLVSQMLTFVQRPGDTNAVLDPAPVLVETCQMLRTALPPGIELTVALQAQRPMVAGNADDLRQVLLNLVLNARDALGADGRIAVTLDGPCHVRGACRACQEPLDDDYVILRVSDNGCGIAPSDLGRIFDPFYTTKEVGSGAGLGLSVVHGIVHRDGGHVLAESSPAPDTTIEILLKPMATAPASTASTALTAPRVRRAPACIAVVDDEPAVGGLIRELLEADGYSVDLFASGEAALAAIADAPQRHALLVTDLTMPRMGGLELAAAVRALRPTLPIVVCTGYNEAVERGPANVPGIAHWFRKPLPIGDFLHIISQLTGTPIA